MSDVMEKLGKLAAELEAMRFEENVPVLKVTRIHDDFKHLLTPAAMAALEHDIPATIGTLQSETPLPCPCGYPPPHCTKNVEYTRAVYLSVIARSPEGLLKAAEAIYGEVNKLHEQGLLRGNLCLLSMLRMSDAPDGGALSTYELGPGVPATAIFCFPHVPMEAKVEGPYFTEEGGVSVDLEPHLKPAVLKEVTFAERLKAKVDADMAANTIERMEKCCPEDPCFVDECGKCSGGPPAC